MAVFLSRMCGTKNAAMVLLQLKKTLSGFPRFPQSVVKSLFFAIFATFAIFCSNFFFWVPAMPG